MLRNYLILVFALGLIGSMMGRTGPHSIPHEVQLPARSAQTLEGGAAQTRYGADQSPLEEGAVELDRNDDGHFYADVRINGALVHMLVDTGATGVALSRADARSAGVATSIGMNDVVGRGADGDVRGEFVSLDRVELGSKRIEGIDAIVLNSGEQSLLGQSMLSQFGSVEIQGDRMVLR